MPSLFSDQHIMKKFDDELESVCRLMMEMGGRVETQLKRASESVLVGDSGIAEEVMRNEPAIDQMEQDLDEACILILVKRQPAARDLRLVFSITRGVRDLERIGDEANKIAEHSIELTEQGALSFGYEQIQKTTELASSMLHQALDSFARFDEMSARAVINKAKRESTQQETLQEVLTFMMDNPERINLGVNLLWILRSMQRICDHSVNICEQTIFVIKGEDVRHL